MMASAPAAGQNAVAYDSVRVNGITLAYRDGQRRLVQTTIEFLSGAWDTR